MVSVRPALWVWFLAGCAPEVPLPATPIRGGTPEVRDAIRRQLAEFDHHVGPGRLSIPEVRVAPSERLGSTHRWTGRITLAEDLPLDDVPWVLRHELCHALDFAEGLAADPDPLLDDLADGLFDPESGVVEVDAMYHTERLRRSEALASFCSLGPLGAAALREPCGDEPAQARRVADWLVERVWIGATPPLLAWEADDSPRWTADADLLAITSDEVPPDLPASVTAPDLAGWTEGPGAVLAPLDLFHLGASERRLFVHADGAWRVATPGCERPGQALFAVEGAVGTTWNDGSDLRWRVLAFAP